jgi:hypothetical protein
VTLHHPAGVTHRHPLPREPGFPLRRATARYEIRIKGGLGADASSVFEPLTVEPRGHETVLHGEIADQAALHGILDRIQDLGLQLIEVRRLPNDSAVPLEGTRP